MRWMNRLFAALVVLVVLAAPPAAATVWVSAHRPWRRLSADRVRAWLQDPPLDTAILLGVLGIATMLWLLLVVLVGRRLYLRARNAWRRCCGSGR
jgi:hypothetical protein